MEIISYAYQPEISILDMAFKLSGLSPNCETGRLIPQSVIEAVYSMCESIECGYLPARDYALNSNGDWWLVKGIVREADIARWASTRGIQWPPIRRKQHTNLFDLTMTRRHPDVVAWANARSLNWPREKKMPKIPQPKNRQNKTAAEEQAIHQMIAMQAEQRRKTETQCAEQAELLRQVRDENARLTLRLQQTETQSAEQVELLRKYEAQVTTFEKMSTQSKPHPVAEHHAINRELVLAAAIRTKLNSSWRNEPDGTAVDWATKIINHEAILFDDGKCPLTQSTVERIISSAMNEGRPHKGK